ncbi:hypothetical protein [Dokdonella sp.]
MESACSIRKRSATAAFSGNELAIDIVNVEGAGSLSPARTTLHSLRSSSI